MGNRIQLPLRRSPARSSSVNSAPARHRRRIYFTHPHRAENFRRNPPPAAPPLGYHSIHLRQARTSPLERRHPCPPHPTPSSTSSSARLISPPPSSSTPASSD